jgi:hypothetical protein
VVSCGASLVSVDSSMVSSGASVVSGAAGVASCGVNNVSSGASVVSNVASIVSGVGGVMWHWHGVRWGQPVPSVACLVLGQANGVSWRQCQMGGMWPCIWCQGGVKCVPALCQMEPAWRGGARQCQHCQVGPVLPQWRQCCVRCGRPMVIWAQSGVHGASVVKWGQAWCQVGSLVSRGLATDTTTGAGLVSRGHATDTTTALCWLSGARHQAGPT